MAGDVNVHSSELHRHRASHRVGVPCRQSPDRRAVSSQGGTRRHGQGCLNLVGGKTEHQEGPWSTPTRRAQRRTSCSCPSSRTGRLSGEGRSRREDGLLAGRGARGGRCRYYSVVVAAQVAEPIAKVLAQVPPYLALIAGKDGELTPRQEALDASVHLVQRARRGTPDVPIGGCQSARNSRRG
jgi:hypothetical protein